MTTEQEKELNECIRKFGESHKGKSADEILSVCRGAIPLSEQYADVCNAYGDALNEMWQTDGYWINDNCDCFDVADCVIGINEVRELVDRKIDFDTFIAWYDYDTQTHYALELGKKVNTINLHNWLNGFPENKKVPKETLDAWEKEFWDKEWEKNKGVEYV